MPPYNIALIEDDPLQQIILRTMLQDNFGLHVYGGYIEAMHEFSRDNGSKPDLILCDMTLSDGDGMALRRELQQHDSLRSCPFIFLTGLDDDQIKRQAIDIGIDDYLRKPIEKEALIETLDRTLKRSRQLQQAVDDRLNHQLTEPLQPSVPDRIGDYRLILTYQQVMAGGGDFAFHLQAMETDFIVIGDVMGHGAPAKFFLHAYAGYLYGMVQSFRHYHFTPTAADLMRILNHTLATDSFLQRWLMTCQIICLHPEGRVTLASAGHPFSWRVGPDGLEPVTKKSVMPGLLKDTTFENVSLTLKKNERLLLATDGANVETHAHDNLTAMSFLHLTGHLMRFADPHDDATILLIERV